MVVAPEKGGIKINQVRKLSRDLSYPPYESAMRVVILEDVHAMRQEAANSLLKTLEEPPENNLLILTAESSREILATLTSRCQVVPFCRLGDGETAGILEGHGVDPTEALLLAHLFEGSPGQGTPVEGYRYCETVAGYHRSFICRVCRHRSGCQYYITTCGKNG